MYVDSVVVTFRRVIERFIAVWTLVRLFPGTVDQMESSRYSKDRTWVKDQSRSHVLESFVRL